MASSDDFRQLLKAGKITEALALALSEAIELKITTWVASETDEIDTTIGKPGHRLHTRINTIAGDIENEIGDRFLSNGPYRELRQFHLDQVAEGNEIVQNNLKSLQKLFEVLVAMRYPDTDTAVITPESVSSESQTLPQIESVTEAGLVLETPEAVVEEIVSSPNAFFEPDIAIEPPLTQEPTASVTIPTAPEEVLDEDEEDEDDWDEAVLELLESLPVAPPPSPEEADAENAEGWGWEEESTQEPQPEESLDEGNDLESSTTLLQPNSELSRADFDAEWGDLLDDDDDEPDDEIEPEVTESFDDRENLESPPPPPTPNIATGSPELDEDWGDLVEEEPELNPAQPVPSIESLDLEDEEDWDDWVEEEPEAVQDEQASAPELSAWEDDDWGDLVDESESLAAEHHESESDLDDENWDEFSPEELEPFSDLPDVDTRLDTSIDRADPLAKLNTTESVLDETAAPDLRDQLKTDTLPADDSLDNLEQVPESSDRTNSLENAKSDRDERDLASDTDAAGNSTSTEVSQNNTKANPQSVEKRFPPPPPPPSRFPNQNY
ncbi:MAG TPA: hypothetical protein V6C85_32025 [Allocoleopsis sp.]